VLPGVRRSSTLTCLPLRTPEQEPEGFAISTRTCMQQGVQICMCASGTAVLYSV